MIMHTEATPALNANPIKEKSIYLKFWKVAEDTRF